LVGAPPKASETTKKPGLLKAKPNGVVPLEGLSIGALGSPFPSNNISINPVRRLFSHNQQCTRRDEADLGRISRVPPING